MARPLEGGAVAKGSRETSPSSQFTRRSAEAGNEAADLCTAPAVPLDMPAQPLVVLNPGKDPVDRTTVAARLEASVFPVQGPGGALVLPGLSRGPAPLNAGIVKETRGIPPVLAGLKLLLAVVAALPLKWRATSACRVTDNA